MVAWRETAFDLAARVTTALRMFTAPFLKQTLIGRQTRIDRHTTIPFVRATMFRHPIGTVAMSIGSEVTVGAAAHLDAAATYGFHLDDDARAR